ncbi:MAG: A/G-specific adenine glycosylase [Eubacteriales bacterium]|nr:A/G-specific adenine glycosylase [Eubacteriales bacterium]
MEENRLKNIVEPLLAWFDGNARVLPWREEPTPYRVWISEIMLQQTRVEAVKPFYERFLEALPDIPSLAACPEDRLLKLWEGLGYYNRARNLQKAAQVLVSEYQAEMPPDYDAIRGLPGIGPYTAGAVASIAYGIPVPAVDGNVLRVLSRILTLEEDVLKQSVKRRMEEQIQAVIPKERPGAFNQALMELGATVCVPNGPAKCGVCPLHGLCLANQEGRTGEFPKKTPKKARKIEERTVLVIRDGERAAIRKRPDKGLLAGLYELPNLPGRLGREDVLRQLEDWGMVPVHIRPLKEAKHIFSHIEWHMTGYAVRVAQLEQSVQEGLLFVEPFRTEKDYPIPAAFAAYTEELQIRLGQEKYEAEIGL